MLFLISFKIWLYFSIKPSAEHLSRCDSFILTFPPYPTNSKSSPSEKLDLSILKEDSIPEAEFIGFDSGVGSSKDLAESIEEVFRFIIGFDCSF